MMRVRCDGGAISAAALRALGTISTEFARDTADISDRENIQYHWIEVENVPEIWRRLDEVGLQTTEACGDCPRVVLGSPLAGESLDEVIDPTWAIEEIVRRYIGKPDFADLPRKYKTAISGLQDVVHEINDIAFVGVNHPDHGPGLDLWVGGGLSTNPMLGQRVGAWVPLDEVPEVWAAVTSVFRDYGYRRLRAKARLKFLIKDWGIEKFREVLEREYLKRPLIDGPAPEPVTHPVDHVGVQRQKNGLNAVGAAPIAGRVSGTILTGVADVAQRAGSDRIRFTAYQKLVILDIPDDKLDDTIAGLQALGLQTRPSHWRRNLMACSGIEFCKLSFAETRGPCPILGARAGAPAGGHQLCAGRADNGQHQRLPEFLRANSDRRYRIQRPDGGRRPWWIGRGLPGASGRQSRPRQRFRPKTSPAQGEQRGAGPTISIGWSATSSSTAPRENASRSGSFVPMRTICDERVDQAGRIRVARAGGARRSRTRRRRRHRIAQVDRRDLRRRQGIPRAGRNKQLQLRCGLQHGRRGPGGYGRRGTAGRAGAISRHRLPLRRNPWHSRRGRVRLRRPSPQRRPGAHGGRARRPARQGPICPRSRRVLPAA